MHSKAKNYSLVFCLFVSLFVIIGGGLLPRVVLRPGSRAVAKSNLSVLLLT
jgi:hypothetical protein